MEPPEIKKLALDVINRIAAGEIIQRPANALKELIENSLDAKSTNIQITVKNGGLKLLQIQDNGTGIRKEDFDIVCERFTTSKLTEFEDLHKLNTYGFRGEALASMSHIAHLSIVSKTKNDICAYKASYVDGNLQGAPKPTAGNQGTVITIEDLFYNMHVRRKALRCVTEEYQKISDVVGKYAVHNSSVGFALKKSGANNDIRTPISSNTIDNIKIIYGNSIARELIEFSLENKEFKFKAKGYITNVNYSTKKFQFLLFINHRLVDCSSLRKSLDLMYSTYLPKNAHPFIYLSLELDPGDIDVNVHPTKHEVRFLNEAQIVETILGALETKILASNNSRVFYTQAKLPKVFEITNDTSHENEELKSKNIYPKDFVRTDAKEQKLEKFFGPAVKVGKPKEKKSEPEMDYLELSTETKKSKVNVSITEEEFQREHELFMERNEQFENRILDKTVESVIDETPPQSNEKDNPEEDFVSETNNIDEKPAAANGKTFTTLKNTEKPALIDEDTCKNVEIATTTSKHEEKATVADDSTLKKDRVETKTTTSKKSSKREDSISSSLVSKVTRVDTKLTSVLQLRKEVEDNCHKIIRETFAQHVFVGPITTSQALVQFSTKLYLCNTKKILFELFYQFVLYNFQNFDKFSFANKLPVKELAMIGLELPETGWTPEDGDKVELAQRVTEILTDKSPMLLDYFSMEIDEYGNLCSIPILLENYIPDLTGLPMYVIRLATEVSWEGEKECFRTFARETAKFYAGVSEETNENGHDWKWVTEHVLYPAIKDYFIPPKSFVDNAAILEIANLPNLYKVFERC